MDNFRNFSRFNRKDDNSEGSPSPRNESLQFPQPGTILRLNKEIRGTEYSIGDAFICVSEQEAKKHNMYILKIGNGIGESCFIDPEGRGMKLLGDEKVVNSIFEKFELKTKPEMVLEEGESYDPETDPTAIMSNKLIQEFREFGTGLTQIQKLLKEISLTPTRVERGEKGDKGDRGERGEKGEKGEKGEQGERGEKGETGLPGAEGAVGPQGVAGERGEKGDRGEVGPQGEQGEKGEKGDRGEVGPQGERGDAGPQGEQGERGEPGKAGDRGERGFPGKDGKDGKPGPKGDRGERGEQGSVGPQGKPGPKGEKGDKGDKGDSGVVSAKFPLVYDADEQSIGIDEKRLDAVLKKILGGGKLSPADMGWLASTGGGGKIALYWNGTKITPDVRGIDLIGPGVASVTKERGAGGKIIVNIQGGGGPSGVTGYYGSFYDDTNQKAALANTAYIINVNKIVEANGVTLADGGQIVIDNAGVYNVQFSTQLANSDGGQFKSATIWLRKRTGGPSGPTADIPGTAGTIAVPPTQAGITGQVVAGWNYILSLAANDVLEYWWHAESTSVSLETLPVGTNPVHPLSPSMIVTVQQVANTLSGVAGSTGATGATGPTGPAGPMPTDYVVSFNGKTGAIQGVSSAVAGSGISVSAATGSVTISNTGVLSFNGLTGNVQGVSSWNGQTGAVSFNNYVSSLNSITGAVNLRQGTGIQIESSVAGGITITSTGASSSDIVTSFNGGTGAVQGVSAAVAGSFISVSGATGSVTITNIGVHKLNGITAGITLNPGTDIGITYSSIGGITISYTGSGSVSGDVVTSFNGRTGAVQGVSSAVAGTGISVSAATGSVTITNTGVLSFNGNVGNVQGVSAAVAGTGVSVSSATGSVTITNTGVLSFNGNIGNVQGVSANVAGTGISVSAATGSVTISNTGVLSFNGNTGVIQGVSSWNGQTGSVTFVDYVSSFNGLTGSVGGVSASQSNTFTALQIFSSGISASGGITLQSPNLTGTPTATTPSLSDNSTKIATTAWVQSQGYGIGSTQVVTSFNGLTGAVQGVSSASAGSGILLSAATGAVTITNTGVLSFNGNAGNVQGVSSWNGQTGAVVFADYISAFNGRTGSIQGVSAAVAGSGIAVSGATGSVTITNTGVLSFNGNSGNVQGVSAAVSGTGISVSAATGSVTITNTGVLSFNGNSGNVQGVSSWNGLTGTVTFVNYVSAFNGLTGSVIGASLGANTFTDVNTFSAGLCAAGGITFNGTVNGATATFTKLVSFTQGISAAGATLGGIVTAPTPAVGTNNTQVATTAFVQNEIIADAVTAFNGRTGSVQGVSAAVAGTGISVSAATGSVTITNTGVLSFNGNTGNVQGVSANVAGNGISVSAATGSVTITNTGVLSFNGVVGNVQGVSAAVAGTGVSVSAATGSVTITNTGVLSFNGNSGNVQGVSAAVAGSFISVSGATGAVTFTNIGVHKLNGITAGITLNPGTDIGITFTSVGGITISYTGVGGSTNVVTSFNGLTGAVQGVSAAVAGSFISVSGATGAVTFTNIGVQKLNGITGGITLNQGTDIGITFTSVGGITISYTGVGGSSNVVTSFNGLTGAVQGVTVGGTNTFTAVNTFSAGLCAAGGITFNGVVTGATAFFNKLFTFTAGLSGNGITLSGNLSAATKSFVIPHPMKKGKWLRHGSLEGPENGVYVRGKTDTDTIVLPEYWRGLVYADTITVNLTSIGSNDAHWVHSIKGNKVKIASASGTINCFYTVFAERKDVPKLTVEY